MKIILLVHNFLLNILGFEIFQLEKKRKIGPRFQASEALFDSLLNSIGKSRRIMTMDYPKPKLLY